MSGKMKNILIVILSAVLILVVVLLIVRPFDNDTPPVASNTPTPETSAPDSPPPPTETPPPPTETPVTLQPPESPNTNDHQPEIVIDKGQISRFFDMNKDGIFQLLGDNYEIVATGAEGLLDGYAYQDHGLTFIFRDETNAVYYIEPYFIEAGFNENDDWVHSVSPVLFEAYGITAAMNFNQIEEHLGDGNRFESFIETPENKTFCLAYKMGNYSLEFISFSEDGANPRLALLAE